MREPPGVMEWWSDGALQNIKFQAPSLRVSGVRIKKKYKLKRVGAKRKSRLKRSGSGEH